MGTTRGQQPFGLVVLVLLAAGCSRSIDPGPAGATGVTLLARPSSSPDRRPAVRLVIAPGRVTLAAGDPGVQLVALDGSGVDVTARAIWSVEPAYLVTIDDSGFARPLARGRGQVAARLGADVASVPLDVADPAARPWDFAVDVLPVLTRAGCNGGACHGRASGQGGFHLSLYGHDAAGDLDTIARAEVGRRLDRIRPEASLLLAKATGQVPHAGGPRLVAGSAEHALVRDWIAAGAPATAGATHGPVVALAVEPPALPMPGPASRQLRILARHADGHARDVTRLASFRTLDERTVAITPGGRLALLRPGETDVVVRFGTLVATVRASTPHLPHAPIDLRRQPRRNLIDDHLFRRLKALGVPPSPEASDAVFLRRASLDLTGQLPEPEEVRAFLEDGTPDKRARKVDELMARPDFLDFWALKLGDLLQISQARFAVGAGPYQSWLRRRLAENARWDAMVVELLTALGDPADPVGGGPANYALDGPDPATRAERTARRFLGLRIQCARCHDHPFDTWTQDDYYGLAAFFARVEGPAPVVACGQMPSRRRVEIVPEGRVVHPRTGSGVSPRFLDRSPATIAPGADPRVTLAYWMTRPENPYFARFLANWTWAQFFGRGLVEPVDDMGPANPPVHPELLDALAHHFAASYDLRDLIRTIATSEAYALGSAPIPDNAHDDRFFSHHRPRPLSAHQMADALVHATQVPLTFANRSLRGRTKAIQVFDPGTPSVLLDTFGRCTREATCSPVGAPALSLRQALLLVGGDAVDSRVSDVRGYLAGLLELDPEPAAIVAFLYYRTLCRPPTDEEAAHWAAVFDEAGATHRRETAEDLFWALLNCREFAFNH